MYDINWLAIIVAALVPTITGFLYYNPKMMGTAWMKSIGMTEEEVRDGFNMPVAMVVGLVTAFLMAFLLDALVEMTHKEVNDAGELIYGSFHTFKHGAFHGLFYGVLFACPILITNGLYQRNSWQNILINCGYWVLTIAIMVGILDAWM